MARLMPLVNHDPPWIKTTPAKGPLVKDWYGVT